MATVIQTNLVSTLEGVLAAILPYTQDDAVGRPWLQAAKDALASAKAPRTDEEEKYLNEARDQWANNECEIDDDASVSIGEDGAFVQAWVFVENDRAEDDEDEDRDIFRNHYECHHEGRTAEGTKPSKWSDDSPYTDNDRCPICNKEVEPYESEVEPYESEDI